VNQKTIKFFTNCIEQRLRGFAAFAKTFVALGLKN